MAAASTRPPSGLWPPSSQRSQPGGASAEQAALGEALQAAGPVGADQARFEGRGLEGAEAGGAQGRDGGAGIDELVTPDELRPRQVEKPVLVLIDEASALLVDGEILRADEDRPRADRARPPRAAPRRPAA